MAVNPSDPPPSVPFDSDILRSFFELTLGSLLVSSWLWSPGLGFTIVSHRVRETFPSPNQSPSGLFQNLYELAIMTPDTLAPLQLKVQALEKGESSTLIEEVTLTPLPPGAESGLLKATTLRDHNGERLIVGVILDISQQKGSERLLTEASQKAAAAAIAKTQFLTNMSHEIRTPLTAIIGFSEALSSSTISPLERERFTQLILSNSRHLLNLVNELLDLSKIDAGGITTERIAFNATNFLDELQQTMEAKANEKGLDLSVLADRSIPKTISSDPLRIRQVLTNLISNAIKFTFTGSVQILVKFVKSESLLVFTVADTGIGIPEDVIPGLFSPFYQADASTSRRFGGTGLGLAISKQLTEALGGSIEVQSTLGKGTTFTVNIPVAVTVGESSITANNRTEVADSISPRTAVVSNPPESAKGNILIAEDVRDNRTLLEFFLAESGYELTFAENGQDAINKAIKGSFDLILMDMQMPVIDGYTATKELRERGFTIPIVALTAHTSDAEITRCKEVGITTHFPKPFNKAALIGLIDSFLSALAQEGSKEGPEPESAMAKTNASLSSSNNNDDVLANVRHLFLSGCEEKLAELRALTINNHFEKIGSIAHDIAGTAGLLELRRLAQAAKDLEATSRKNHPQLCQEAVELLTRAYEASLPS